MSLPNNFKSDKIDRYLNVEYPTHQETVDAYYDRDIQMGLTLDNVFDNSMNKLCLSPESIESLIKHEFKSFVNRKIKEYLNKPENKNIVFNFNKFYSSRIISDKYQNNVKKYNQLLKFKETNNHLGFYNSLTLDDLENLGF